MAKRNTELNEAQKNAIEAKKANIQKAVSKKTARRKGKRKDAEREKVQELRSLLILTDEVAE